MTAYPPLRTIAPAGPSTSEQRISQPPCTTEAVSIRQGPSLPSHALCQDDADRVPTPRRRIRPRWLDLPFWSTSEVRLSTRCSDAASEISGPAWFAYASRS